MTEVDRMGKFHKAIELQGSGTFLLAVNIVGHGAPTEHTEAEPGMIYMDVDSENGDLYKCIKVTITEQGSIWLWKKLVESQELEILKKEIATKANKTGWTANKYLGTDADGNMVEKEAPQTGTGGITEETDPTVPAWAKEPEKPTYTASEVGALPASTEIPANTSDLNNDSGYITIAVATLLNYYLKTEVYAKAETYSQTEVDNLISGLDKRLNAIADSEDVDLDQFSELVAYIKANKSLIDSITTSKVSVSDIVDNLTTGDSMKPLSAAQGKALKALYDAIPAWAKASSKPLYSKSDVGLGNVDNVKQYSASNPPPYPVKSVNGKTGAVTFGAADVGAATTEQFERLSKEIADYEKNPLKGKKVSFIGDSICAGSNETYLGGYGKIIADRNNMVYENLGKGGSTITAETYSSSTGVAKGWLCRMVDSMSADADYAIIEGGVNDAWQLFDHGNLTIGSISDGYNATLDDTTYYGAFESMLKKLITRFQGKKIGYIAIPRTMNLYSNSENVPNFYHIALECCGKWGVPVCDLNTITPPTACLDAVYCADGTHPTYEGYLKYYCDPIEAWMKTLTTGGNNAASVALKAVEEYTKGFNDAIKALQDGKLDNTGISFRKALLPLADGTTIEIDVLTAVDGSVVIPYINQVPLSVDTDKVTIFGEDYNGDGKNDGYRKGYRLSSSGATKTHAASAVTGYIKAKGGDVIRIFNCGFSTTEHAMNYICAYDGTLTFVGGLATQTGATNLTVNGTNIKAAYEYDADGNATFTLNNAGNIEYIRVSSMGAANGTTIGYDPAEMIVTVNQEIT